MACKRNFNDCTPIRCLADKVIADDTNLTEYLKYNHLMDEKDTVKNELGDKKKENFPYRAKKTINTRNEGIFTESRPCLRPHVQTRYQTVINELQDTSFRSHWDTELGRTKDPTGDLPAGTDPLAMTYGKHYIREYGVKELINPPKTPYEVLWCNQVGHELYKKTHNDYNPGECVHRKYSESTFDSKKQFGHKTIYDLRGIWVDCACTWYENEPVVTVNQIQADVAVRRKHQLGKCLEPNENMKCVPEGFMFLKPCKREMCGVDDLLKDSDFEPCLFKRNFLDWIEHLNELRAYIKRRKGAFIDLKDLHNSILFYDKENKGYVPVSVLYEVCKCHNLNFNREKMDALTSLMGIQHDNFINYNEFINLIDVNGTALEIMKVQDIPEKHHYFITTNMAASCDYLTMDNRGKPIKNESMKLLWGFILGLPVAGLPTIRTDLPRPKVAPRQCKADLISLGDETTAAAIVNPSIFTNYGLSHRDFFLPRHPEFLKKLFDKLGYEFPGDTFEQLWKIGLDLDKTGLVCIDTFRLLFEKSLPPRILNSSEQSYCS